MKITTKIASGYAVLIVLLVCVFVYQGVLIHRMQSINQNLGGLSFRAATLALQLMRDLDQVEEFTRKLFATGGDPGYAIQREEMQRGFSATLAEIQSLTLGLAEMEAVGQLERLWRQAVAERQAGERALQLGNLAQAQQALERELMALTDVRIQTQNVMRVTREAIPAQVAVSEAAAQRAQSIFVGTAGVALLLSVLVCAWVVRSISRPLSRLQEGTQAVAEGEFSYRLDESGEDELAAVARDFNWMTQRLSELDQMKKDFVAHVSHELKTPLASMQETIRLLLDEIPGPLTSQQRRLLQLNLQSSSRLSTLIANLLDLSRMEAGVMDYVMERHDLAQLVKGALEELEVPMRECDLRLEMDLPEDPFWLDCDADRVTQVLHNVLGNAIKFSPQGSSIHVSLRYEKEAPEGPTLVPRLRRGREGDGYALLRVSDRGPGIPAESKPKVFEKFHQVHRGRKHPNQGTGLGLAISRTIVEVHGGAIWAEDNPGGGSRFSILLPAGEMIPQETPRASAPI